MKKLIFVLTAVAALVVVAGQTAKAELITNGGFESGSFAGWTVTDLAGGSGSWFIDTPGTTTPLSGTPTLAAGSAGSFYAVTDQFAPGTHVLTQSFTVSPLASSVFLSFDMFMNDADAGPIFGGQGLSHVGAANQFGTVDILTAAASVFDTGAGVLGNLVLGVDAGPDPHAFTPYGFDITGLVTPGGTFQVRFGEVDNQLFFNMGVDNVSITQELVPEPSSLALLTIGAVGLFGYGWRRKRKQAA